MRPRIYVILHTKQKRSVKITEKSGKTMIPILLAVNEGLEYTLELIATAGNYPLERTKFALTKILTLLAQILATGGPSKYTISLNKVKQFRL